jgi:hypothetical protein
VPFWFITTIAIVLVTLSLNYATRLFFRNAELTAQRSEVIWDDALIGSAAKPVRLARRIQK